MCGMCGLWSNLSHWSDASRLPPNCLSDRPPAAIRISQARAISSFTQVAGITVKDWMQTSWIVEGASGVVELASSITQVWQSVDKLAGQNVDPLSTEFLKRFEAKNNHDEPR